MPVHSLPNYIRRYNSAIFRKRAESWLFSLDWGEMIVNIEKPLHKLQTAIQSVLDSDSLTFVMGMPEKAQHNDTSSFFFFYQLPAIIIALCLCEIFKKKTFSKQESFSALGIQ